MRTLTAWLLLGLAVTTPALASAAAAPAAPPSTAQAPAGPHAPPAPAPAAAAQGQATPAAGLIVRLKQPLPHAMDAAPGAPEHASGAANLSREHLRWQRVLLRAGLAGDGPRPAPARRAAGRDLQWLDFGRVLPARDVQALAARLAQQPEVDWVAPNTRERLLQAGAAEPFVLPNDPLFAQQWWLQPAGGSDGSAPAQRLRGVPGFQRAWASGLPGATGTLAPGVVIAVLDTGITPHPELQGRLLPGYDFISDAASANDGDGRDPDPADPGDWVDADDLAQPRFADCTVARSSWHGTLIAGLLAARTGNAQGVAAIHPAARILPVRVAGKCGASVVDIIDGMRWAAGLPVPGVPLNPHPARIINISFGGPAACGLAYQATLQELDAAGVVVVAASGNGFGAVSRPANCAGVVGVVALNRDGFKTHYANFGPELAGRGLATVGGDDAAGGAWGALLADGGLVSIWNDGEREPGQPAYAALYGTSFAAPLVSGTLSLMLAVNPALTAAQLRQGLLQSARPHVLAPALPACSDQSPGRCACTTASCGVGILDADMALRYAVAPVTWVAPPRSAATVDTAELRSALALGPDRPPNPVQTTPPGDGADDTRRVSSGGGAAAPAWVLALLGAVVALWRTTLSPAGGPEPLSAPARRPRRLRPLTPKVTPALTPPVWRTLPRRA